MIISYWQLTMYANVVTTCFALQSHALITVIQLLRPSPFVFSATCLLSTGWRYKKDWENKYCFCQAELGVGDQATSRPDNLLVALSTCCQDVCPVACLQSAWLFVSPSSSLVLHLYVSHLQSCLIFMLSGKPPVHQIGCFC